MHPAPRRTPLRLLAAAAVVLVSLVGCSLPTLGNGSDPTPSSTPQSPDPTPTGKAPLDRRPIEPIPDVQPQGFTDPPAGSGLSRYEGQKLSWRSCGKEFTCTQVRAPLDYAKPDGTALTLTLARRAATAKPRLGTLFINPGGPGGSGVQYVGYFDAKGLANYDIVGWDPRGVGYSTPVECYGSTDLDRYFSIDNSPDTSTEEQALLTANLQFGQSCLRRSGELLEHISTTETVRDLDLLRGLVGDDKINYFGSSYGTQIGSLYAQLFPQRVGRMVLDGAVDISGKDDVTQIQGFERALGDFAAWSVTRGDDLGGSKAAVLDRVHTFLNSLDQRPITVGNRSLTQQLGVEGVIYPMYGGEDSWKALRTALISALSGDGKPLLALADDGNFRASDGSYNQLAYSFPAIRCLDSQDVSVTKAEADLTSVEKKAPVLARLSGSDLVCPLWPVAPAPKPPHITGEGAAPIVVVGTTGDPATPYEYAETMAEQLESGRLITFHGEGHLAYGKSDCVRTLVDAYLVRDQVPPDHSVC